MCLRTACRNPVEQEVSSSVVRRVAACAKLYKYLALTVEAVDYEVWMDCDKKALYFGGELRKFAVYKQ